jgi:hypothetical protein
MARVIITFFVLSILIALCIQAVRKMNGLAKWNLTKTVLFSTLCSVIAIAIMIGIVVLF